MKILYKNKNWKINEDYDINKILYLLIDRPNHINYHKDFIWINKIGEYYRNYDLPAIVHYDGSKLYFINGKFIKTDFTT